MAISVSWEAKIINVPKADTQLIQSTPTEIRELDLNTFHLTLRALESSEEGIPYVKTHNHVAPIDVGGITLARVIEIINNYTITFEDGQYAVNLKGANSNIGDRVNVNQVSVRSFNSAGLVTSDGIEAIEYENAVTIWSDSQYVGTVYPMGTYRKPVSNTSDANLIATKKGFSKYVILHDFTFSSTDILDEFEVWGEAPSKSTLVFDAGVSTIRTEIFNAMIEGDVEGAISITDCHIRELVDIGSFVDETNIVNSLFEDIIPTPNLSFKKIGIAPINILDCWSGIAGDRRPIIDINGTSAPILFRNYSGGLKIINATGGNEMSFDFASGSIEFDSSCTDGIAIVRGDVDIIDNSGAGFTVINKSTTTLLSGGLGDLSEVLNIVTKLQEYTINKMTIDATSRAPEVYMQIWDDTGTIVTTEHRLRNIAGNNPEVDPDGIASRDGGIIL